MRRRRRRNKLSAAERAGILTALNSPEFVDLAPMQVYTKLLDEGIYLGSLSFYRVLEENRQVKERRRLAKHPPRAVPELVATAPGQVFTWDITKLVGPVKGKYFDCYKMVDIHFRFIVGAHVHTTESGALAVEMMKEIFGIHGIPQVVHAERGTSMTSKTVAALLPDLEVTRSHSRPRVSNDNPYSESIFKTLKYGPELPERFASVHDAGAFISGFVDWDNHHHRHSGIGFALVLGSRPADWPFYPTFGLLLAAPWGLQSAVLSKTPGRCAQQRSRERQTWCCGLKGRNRDMSVGKFSGRRPWYPTI